MFERTALPAGPRVISARLPAAVRSPSRPTCWRVAPRDGGRGRARPTSWSTSPSRERRPIPTSRAISEAIEGVGGSFNAATDRESTVYWVRVPRREAERAMEVLGELIIRPMLDEREIDQERGDHHRGDPLLPRRPGRVLPDPVPAGDVRDGPLGREICGDEAGIRAAPGGAIRDFWEATYRPANTVVAVAGDIAHADAIGARRRRRSAPATGLSRALRRPRRCPPASGPDRRRDTTPGPALDRGARAPPRPPEAWTLAVLNAVLGDGMSSRLFLAVREDLGLAYDISSGLVEYADAGALEVSAGVDPPNLARGDRGDPRRARPPPRRAGPGRRAGQGQGVPAGRPGAADGRDAPPRVVDRRPGGPPRPGPDARRGARGGRRRDARRRPARSPRELFRDEALRMAVVAPARYLRGLDRHLRSPA